MSTAQDVDTLGLGFSALIALGGLMGFLKKGSVPSLVAGLGSGAAMAYGATNDHRIALATSGLLVLVMGRRFLTTRKVMPAGLVAVLSSFFTYRYYQLLLS